MYGNGNQTGNYFGHRIILGMRVNRIIITMGRDVGTGVAGVALATPRFLNLLNRNFEN